MISVAKSGHAIASIKAVEIRDCTENAALHLDHLERMVVISLVGRPAAILEQQAFETAVVRLAHRGVHADIGGDAGEDHILDCAQSQHQFEIGGAERALARFVDDRLVFFRSEVGDDVPARLAAHQDEAAWPRIADAGADPTRTPALVRRQVGEIGTMALAGVEDVEAFLSRCLEHALDRLDRRAREREIVAHLVDIAADPAEIGLHIDDDECGILRPQVAVIRPRIGIGFYVAFGHQERPRSIW